MAGQDRRAEYSRFAAAMVPETLVSVRADERAQQAAWTCVGRGWCGYGSTRLSVIGRPRKANNGGRLWGEIQRDRIAA
jgi:hypothetical protein